MSLAIENKPDQKVSMLTCYVQMHARYSLIAVIYIMNYIICQGGREIEQKEDAREKVCFGTTKAGGCVV